jgi:hypothetical protein
MLRCPVAAWEGWEEWTTKRDLHEDFERAAAGNCRAVQSYSAIERCNRAPSQISRWLPTSRPEQVKGILLFTVGAFHRECTSDDVGCRGKSGHGPESRHRCVPLKATSTARRRSSPPSSWLDERKQISQFVRKGTRDKSALGKMMVSDDKKQTNPAPKNEAPPENRRTSGADPSKAEEGGEIAAALLSGYSRGEGQKPVSKAYKYNWDAIFAKKKKR